ncbi:DNA polymerase III subunit delta' [Pararhodospirillum oryzae]|uniref:DNA polymerase III subunit delta n=1 Tax=Pararhodospirillum oryzae TaxID=478448 RepID=A0A512H3V7_9PROT|nr:DNA polymerase III subunit delta' [Pararhodospirillum oryzae]GEO80154.1 DNA polymerase III subunit delta' [Pararhodospirillum oryzae]
MNAEAAQAPEVPPPRLGVDLLGHEEAEKTFLGALASGRLAHAWMISGPEGIGKATLAYRIARHMLRPDRDGAGAPGLFAPEPAPASLDMSPDHPVFRRVAAGSHGDLKVIERGWMEQKSAQRRAEIVVGDVRDIGPFMRLTASEGGWRVVLIDEADRMNRNAANALLKELEEPPDRSLLLLVCHNPARLPATVRSRCRRLVLRPLASAPLDALIARHLPDLAPQERATLAGLAEGSLGRALTLARQGGLALCADMLGLLGTAPAFETGRLHGLGDRMARDDAAFAALSDLLPWWLARMVRRGLAEEGPSGPGLPGEDPVAARLLAAAPLDRWIEVWENVGALFERARAVHLDRKQTVLGAFHLVERAFGSS